MTPERHRHVGELYHAALAMAPGERTAFLATASGDDAELQREVESLLTAHAHAGSFIVAPAAGAFTGLPTGGLESGASFVGRRMGAYTIQGALGAGGMGEVYRARDGTLGRDVAIKILPRVFSTDPDRRARFDREARLLAALNHPHIGAIYGVEESDGIRALVLELVEGDTLADRLARGPIPVSKALPIARQIADALEAAHEKGIVHRDLKPANIKITPDGLVKVLDFGLAKAASGDAPGPDLTHAPTLTSDGTRAGVILGTAAYMSPEQARGKPVDKRADIWAFGCVLYEMLTSRSAYASDTISDTIARIIEREPDWRALPAATPPPITRLLRRCLDKDPKRRLHDIADARVEIEDVVSGALLSFAEAAAVLPRQRPVRLPWTVAVLASLVALVTASALTWYVRMTPQTQTAFSQVIAWPGAAAVVPQVNRSLAITPDGTGVVYTGNNGKLFVHWLDQVAPTWITTTTAPVNFLFVSADGRVGFSEGGTLKKVALGGGPTTTIFDTRTGGSRGATWAPNDTIIFASDHPATGLQRVSAGGGEPTVLTRPDKARGELDHFWPEMLPGGRAVLFTIIATTGGLDAAQVAVLDLETKTYKPLIPGGSHAHYVKSGHLVYTARGTLVAVPFDLARQEPYGTPMTVLPRIRRSQGGAGDFIVSDSGTLAYLDAPDVRANTLVRVDRQRNETPLDRGADSYAHPRLSPDGSHAAFFTGESPPFTLKVLDPARHKFVQITSAPAGGAWPVFTFDGLGLLFSGTGGVVLQAADGTGQVEKLGVGGFPTGVTPDGKQVLFNEGGDVKVLTLVGRHVDTLIGGPSIERNGVVSPDGHWLAYETKTNIQGGEFEIYVTPFPPSVSDGRVRISSGTRPLWAPKKAGRELFWVAPDRAIMAAHYDAGAKWNSDAPATIIEGGAYANGDPTGARNYDVFPDGQSFLMVKQPANPDALPKIIVVSGWVEKLKRLVPTR